MYTSDKARDVVRTELIRSMRRMSHHTARLARDIREIAEIAPPDQFRRLLYFLESQSGEMQKILIGYAVTEEDRTLSDAAHALVRQHMSLSGEISGSLCSTAE